MNAPHAVLHQWLASIRGPLVEHLWVSTILLAAALAVTFLLRGAAARTRHLLLLLALMDLLVPAAAVLWILRMAGIDLVTLLHPRPETGALSHFLLPTVFAVGPAPATGSELPCIAAVVWMAGVTAFASRSVFRWNILHRSLLRNGAHATEREARLVELARGRMDVPSVAVVRSESAAVPAVLGVVSPVVILPQCADELEDDEVEAVLAHELMHVRRGDNLIGVGQLVIGWLFWFHPLVWIAQRRLMAERERACDEGVLDAFGQQDAYLLGITRIGRGSLAVDVAAVSCMGSSNLTERLDAIVTYDQRKTRFLSHRIVIATATVALVLLALGGSLSGGHALAAETEPTAERYRLTVKVSDSPGGGYRIEAEVFDPSGHRVSAPGILLPEDGKAQVSSTDDSGRRIEIAVELKDGSGPVTLRVLRDGELLDSETTWVSPSSKGQSGSSIDESAEKITLHLKNADLSDVMRVFTTLTGFPIDVEGPLHGIVSIDVDDVPWTRALSLVLGQNGLTYERNGDRIVVRKDAGTPNQADGSAVAPKLIYKVDAEYTPEALVERVHGFAMLNIVVDEHGNVTDVTVLKGLPFGLSGEAEKAVKQWKFEPGTRNGVAVPVSMTVPVEFRDPMAVREKP